MKIDDTYITLDGLTFHAYHGVMPQERRVGNEFVVDLRLKVDYEQAALTDDLDGTVNYAEVYETVRTEMEQPSALLEHVAARIGRSLLQRFDRIGSVQLRLAKRNPPMGADIRTAAVEMRCKR